MKTNTSSCLKTLGNLFFNCDLFSHTSLFRYKNEDSYPTATGATVSAMVILLFIVLLGFSLVNTFQKSDTIISTSSIEKQSDPSKSILTASPNSFFMFAVGISGIDMGGMSRYFDVDMFLTNRTQGFGTKKVTIPLQPCRKEQWEGFKQEISNKYEALNLSSWLCPKTDEVLSLKGVYTSSEFTYASIEVSKCNQSNPSYPNTTCLNESVINDYLESSGSFIFNFYYVNAIINANKENFIDYYFQDKNFFYFDIQMGVDANVYFSEYQIMTQQSIFPLISDEIFTKGLISHDKDNRQFNIKSISRGSANSNRYIKFSLRKGSQKYLYTRQYQRIDEVLSFVGGLFGIIIIFLSPLKVYSRYCYELSIGERLFTKENSGSFGSDNYNFISWMGDFFNCKLSKKTLTNFQRCREECQKQLNVDYLLERVINFGTAFKIIMESYQRNMLFLSKKPTICEIRDERLQLQRRKKIYQKAERKGGEVYVGEEYFKNILLGTPEKNSPLNKSGLLLEEQYLQNQQQAKNKCQRSSRQQQNEEINCSPLNAKLVESMGFKEEKVNTAIRKHLKQEERSPSIRDFKLKQSRQINERKNKKNITEQQRRLQTEEEAINGKSSEELAGHTNIFNQRGEQQSFS